MNPVLDTLVETGQRESKYSDQKSTQKLSYEIKRVSHYSSKYDLEKFTDKASLPDFDFKLDDQLIGNYFLIEVKLQNILKLLKKIKLL